MTAGKDRQRICPMGITEAGESRCVTMEGRAEGDPEKVEAFSWVHHPA